ncbi:hybrid sensor histidine kinase/response regulator [Salipiger bermudensis]|uniref:histidine kinase n=1 Tax=Salipiger bermudensis (strain DSM 26914 / JCM 13377 / KCTC 12554 / HTCC2601) TaxID=314265 RepID=Q0FLW0_SALBH|nr:PAS-domain containing protein [Salipiger bermudensis]EAU45124.1 sensory box histidine kinase/response regulator [Salipiger bermudensis HTCC2601]
MSKDALTQAGLNLIQQALSIYDSDLRLAVCNRRFAEMFDLPKRLTDEGARFEDTIRHLVERGEYGHVDDPESFIAVRVQQARAFEPHYMERTRANGRTISVEGSPLPQGGWVTVYTDITGMKRQEQLLRTRSELLSEEVLRRSEEVSASNRQLEATNAALQEARRELTEIEARTRLTTEMMPAHLARVDAAGRYTFSNRRLSSVMPGRPSEILGLHVSEALGPAYEKVRPHLERALGGAQSIFEFTDEGSSRRIRAVFTPDPCERGVYILSHDVTEETQARAALQQTKRRELAAQLTSGLAHDFSNLLTIILGMQAKLARMVEGEEAEALITATLQAARRGGELLNRIADITSHRAWRPEPVALARFLRDLETLARPSLPEALALRIVQEAEGAFLIDPGMLQDAALNLVLNAADACGASGEITVAARAVQDTWLELSVADSGPGFSAEALAHGLDPFFTTKGGEGSGLGLAMVYDMVKLAGGEVKLGNGVRGACVTLRLPLRRPETQPTGGLALLVEDNPELRAQVREMLTGIGHSVIEASSVEEACALAEGLEIDLVLSDISLEGALPGSALPGLLPDLPVRLMTSLPPDHPRHVEARQAAPVLAKPFTSDELRTFLGHRRDAA